MKMEPEDLKEITRGIWNKIRADLGIPIEEVESKYNSRLEVCLKCPIRTGGTCDKSKGGCGCPLSVRLRSNKGCPKGRWK